MNNPVLPQLKNITKNLSLEGIISIEITENLPTFRASSVITNRIEKLIEKQKKCELEPQEEQELDCYEEIDDYLSFVNRTIRNLSLQKTKE